MNMGPSAICCRLCINICTNHSRSLYGEDGRRSSVYDLTEKYFTSTFLNMECGRDLTVICMDCWGQILAFDTFQQSVYQAQEKLAEMEKQTSPVVKSEPVDSFPSAGDFLSNTTDKAISRNQSTVSCTDNDFDRRSEAVIKLEPEVPNNEYESHNKLSKSKARHDRVDAYCSKASTQSPATEFSQWHGNDFNDDDDTDVSSESDNTDEEWDNFDDPIGVLTTETPIFEQKTTLTCDADIQSEAVVVPSNAEGPSNEDKCQSAPITTDVLHSNDLLTPKADMLTNANDAATISQAQAYDSMGVAVAKELEESKPPIETLKEDDRAIGAEFDSYETTDTESDSSSESQWSDDSQLATGSDGKNTKKSYSKRRSWKKNAKRPKTVQEFDDLIASWQPNLKCVICSETCSRFSLLVEHFGKLHPDEKCHIRCCQQVFYHRYEIEQHIFYHQGLNVFKCEVCNKCFTYAYYLRDHLRKKHTGNAEETFECPKCSKCYLSKPGLRKHIKYYCGFDQHQALRESSRNHACSQCGKKYKTLRIVQKHKRLVHSGLVANKIFKCTICDKVYKSSYNLRDHIASHSGNHAYTCPHCPKTFIFRRELDQHIITNHRKEWEEKKKKKLENRLTEKKVYNCTTCEKTYKTPLALREHMAHHTGKKMYTCKQCSKVFKYSSNLYAHLKNVHRKKKND